MYITGRPGGLAGNHEACKLQDREFEPRRVHTNSVVTDCETEENQNKINANEWVKQVRCERTGYENKTTRAEPKNKKKRQYKKRIMK